ncbi:MAG: hypothetical protein ER33_13605 [Cyanobium sp. CACIAM 14]|nr:MAG: hypothetical protein ER33_13605 [Cyanobium sp. CACIAM 14]
MSLPPSRSELFLPLLDAIRRRDPAATARCIRRWVHRHGVASLADFRSATVIPLEGSEAGDWLQQQLDGAALTPLAAVPRPAEVPSPPAVEDAFAALEAAFLPLPASAVPPSTPSEGRAPEPPETDLPSLAQLAAIRAGSLPAPSPSALADLRSWLSAAPQHRRAS